MPIAPSEGWILAIDDDPWSLEVTAATLGQHGFQVQRAHNVTEAHTILARLGRPALILVDAMMPNEDGFSVCRGLRRAHSLRHVPIVFLTALNDEAARIAALQAGADDFLTKPAAESMLVTRVKTLIELHRHRVMDDARARFEVVMDAIGEGVITLDESDHIIEVNRAAIALLGLPQAPGPAIHLPSFLARHWSVVRGDVSRSSDARLTWQADGGKPVSAIDWTSRLLPDAGQGVWTAVIRDATDLWERDQALGRLMKSLGHKLRTPLTGVSVSLECAQDCEMDAAARELVELARGSAERLQDTILRILEYVDVAQSEAPDSAVAVPVDPDELESSLELDGDVQFTSSLLQTIRFDLGLARKAIYELVSNARAAGARTVSVVVARNPDGSVQFEVSDDGRGLPAAAERRVFEPFYQLDRSGEEPGTGLGLSILREEIDRAGGSIGARLTAAVNTTIWFRLPDRTTDPSFGGALPDGSAAGSPSAADAPTVRCGAG